MELVSCSERRHERRWVALGREVDSVAKAVVVSAREAAEVQDSLWILEMHHPSPWPAGEVEPFLVHRQALALGFPRSVGLTEWDPNREDERARCSSASRPKRVVQTRKVGLAEY
jgi:hypothetical protein